MKRHRPSGMIAVVGLAVFFASLVSYASVGPKIAVDQRQHDFGQVWEGVQLEHTFTVTNQGDEELLIRYVKTS